MDIESLLNASLALEKRIATDRALRRYFSTVWGQAERQKEAPKSAAPNNTSVSGPARELTLRFPPEMCELLELAAKATGKTPAEILEECFVEAYLKKLTS